VKNEHFYPRWPRLIAKAQTLGTRYRLDLPWVVKNMRLREAMAGLNFNCAVPYGATLSDKTLTTSSFRKIEDNHQRQRRTRRLCPAIELTRGHKLGQRTEAAADVLVGL
jgi:hypothetical protein